ncbi:ubiquinone biosynthesis O-methyltransferase, mitochondrial-like [Bicyclus anynana]|uniref:Ubiquinone biosynthesis O-methyltransferase, mitochondrial-like n=1 Tax=Bicyclus anynana TaxID=110368 RepID=A0ABM3LJR4_BICAN|nr:ubiquinone biosynthesis O-methyltransferase, mitochondrial-like [Bicyclus anynana]XP_052739302.1 ubiquinone biosynthesis O-methyltransferase, mitochondrial-like [Bicyclus anynana]
MLIILRTRVLISPHTVETPIYRIWSPIVSKITNKAYLHNNASPTIDPKDLFQANPRILKTYWDPKGPFKIIHDFNCIRLPYLKDSIADRPGEKLSTCLRGKKILDVGCAGGMLSEGLAMFGAEVTGIDASKELIEVAKSHSSKDNRLANKMPTYILSTIEEHCNEFADSYDALIASEIIDHVNEKELFVESCVRVTKPGGKLYFTAPNKTRFAQFYMIFMFENVLKCFPKNGHQYEKFVGVSQLQHMLEMNDCHVVSTRGSFYYPWSQTWAWTHTKMLSYALEAVKSS